MRERKTRQPGNLDVPHDPQLQWGRSDEGAEDAPKVIDRFGKYGLQWGRSDEGAEDVGVGVGAGAGSGASTGAAPMKGSEKTCRDGDLYLRRGRGPQWGRSDEGAEDSR